MRSILPILLCTVWLSGCESEQVSVVEDRSHERIPPYVEKVGCEFTLVSARGAVSTVSRKGEGGVELTTGNHKVKVGGCQLLENPDGLELYEVGKAG